MGYVHSDYLYMIITLVLCFMFIHYIIPVKHLFHEWMNKVMGHTVQKLGYLI